MVADSTVRTPCAILLITGVSGAGKNTFADALIDVATAAGVPADQHAFADPLKSVCNRVCAGLKIEGDFRQDDFKRANRNLLVEVGKWARSRDVDVFAKLLIDGICRSPNGFAGLHVVTDWRYRNEWEVLNDFAFCAEIQVYTLRIDRVGFDPANDEEIKSLGEIRREVPIDFELSFASGDLAGIRLAAETLFAKLRIAP